MRWCIIADNRDESWAYGPFETNEEAEDFCEKLEHQAEEEGLGIDYQICSLLAPKDFT